MGAPLSIVTVTFVLLLQGLLLLTGKGRSRAPQVLLVDQLERLPLHMPVSLCTLNCVQPAYHVKGLFSSHVLVPMPCIKGR